MSAKCAVPLTVLYAQDGDAWVVLACELSVVTQGDSVEQAREMLKEAVEVYVSAVVELGQISELARPVEPEYLAEYFAGEGVITEYHSLLMTVEAEPAPKVVALEFVPSAVAPFCCHQSVAA